MKALGLVLTLALMGCAAGPGRFATHDQQAYLRIMSDPAAHSRELYATGGMVRSLDLHADGGPVFFVDGFGGQGMYAQYRAGEINLLLGDEVTILFRPLGTVAGVNAFGGPITKLHGEAVAVWKDHTGEMFTAPGYESKAAAWRAGTLFAAR